MTPYLQCFILTLHSGATLLVTLFAADRDEGLQQARKLIPADDRYYDHCGYPCGPREREQGPSVKVLHGR